MHRLLPRFKQHPRLLTRNCHLTHENVPHQQTDVEAGTGSVLGVDMSGVSVCVQEVLEVEGQIVSEDDMELGEPIEEGELAHSSVAEKDPSMYDEGGDFDTAEHTDKESDSELDELEEESSMFKFLINWNARHKITREGMKDLLSGLRIHGHPELPLDPRTLLNTNLTYTVEDRCGGSYVYLSLVKSLQSALSKLHNVSFDSNVELHLQFNIDGLPVFNNSTQCIWPILCRVVKPFISPVCIVALYAGRRKPNSFNDFLQPFVDEMMTILENGVEISTGVRCRVKIHSFVCDAPARADVKRTKHVNYHQGCDKCIVEGTYTKERRMTFNSTMSTKRSDADFELLLLPDEYRVQDSVLRNLQVGMVSKFPLDYMHLTLLGLVRRMARDWQDGLLHSKSFPFRVRRATINALQSAVVDAAVRMPHEFQRRCRSIQECDSWKATEARQFLLYLGPVVLKDVLDEKMYEHFKLLSTAIRCLCSADLIDSYIDCASSWLEKFVNQYIKYYGNKCVYSVHAHCHIADEARTFGVLDNFSGFPFESYLGSLKGMVNKSHQIVQQIVRRISERELSETLPEDRMVLKHKHKCGPEIEGRPHLLQYGGALVGHTHIASDRREQRDCCFVVGNHVCVVRNILAASQSDELYLVYSVYEKVEPLFDTPVDSTDVGIHVVSELSDEVFYATFDNSWHKCARLPLDNSRAVAVQLLHTL